MPMTYAQPTVVTVHDVAWLRVQEHTRVYARYYFGKFAIERYRRAAGIAVDSIFSRDELLEVVPQLDPARVRVVYPSVSPDFCSLERAGGDGKTILVVGTVEKRKNLRAVIEALLPGARFSWAVHSIPRRVHRSKHELDVEDRVEFRYVDRKSCSTCMHRVRWLHALRYEGFGTRQQASVGVPGVSDQSSLPAFKRMQRST